MFFFQHEDCPGLSDACDSLPCGQKCLYNFTSFDEDTLVATHQTPKHRFTLVRTTAAALMFDYIISDL